MTRLLVSMTLMDPSLGWILVGSQALDEVAEVLSCGGLDAPFPGI